MARRKEKLKQEGLQGKENCEEEKSTESAVSEKKREREKVCKNKFQL